MSTFGQKGGEGPTRGKKATTYVFLFPDGTWGRKRSFQVNAEHGFVSCYKHEGKWYASGVYTYLHELCAVHGPDAEYREADREDKS